MEILPSYRGFEVYSNKQPVATFWVTGKEPQEAINAKERALIFLNSALDKDKKGDEKSIKAETKPSSIKIIARKVVVRGEKKWEVLGLDGLKWDELPSEYTWLDEGVFLRATKSGYRGFENKSRLEYVSVGNIYSEEAFAMVLAKIEAAGELLAKINRRLAKENAGWSGVKTFTI